MLSFPAKLFISILAVVNTVYISCKYAVVFKPFFVKGSHANIVLYVQRKFYLFPLGLNVSEMYWISLSLSFFLFCACGCVTTPTHLIYIHNAAVVGHVKSLVSVHVVEGWAKLFWAAVVPRAKLKGGVWAAKSAQICLPRGALSLSS